MCQINSQYSPRTWMTLKLHFCLAWNVFKIHLSTEIWKLCLRWETGRTSLLKANVLKTLHDFATYCLITHKGYTILKMSGISACKRLHSNSSQHIYTMDTSDKFCQNGGVNGPKACQRQRPLHMGQSHNKQRKTSGWQRQFTLGKSCKAMRTSCKVGN